VFFHYCDACEPLHNGECQKLLCEDKWEMLKNKKNIGTKQPTQKQKNPGVLKIYASAGTLYTCIRGIYSIQQYL